MTKQPIASEFKAWKERYNLTVKPNYSLATEADCLAAFQAGYKANNKRRSKKVRALYQEIRNLQAEVQEQCRLNGMGAERELALRARIQELEKDQPCLKPLA